MRHWQDNPPSIVREVMDSEVKYYLGDGKLVSIMKKALQQRIKRLTTPPKKP
jgi:DNA topoisomerase IB